MKQTFLVVLLVGCALIGTQGRTRAMQAGPGPESPVKTRIDAFFAALASGDPAKFEAMAREHYAPAFLAGRTADQRRDFVERVKREFGTLTLNGVRMVNGTATLDIRGSAGMSGRCELTLEDGPSARITRVAMMVGGPGDGDRAAPAAPVNPTMTPEEMSRALDGYLAPLAGADTFAGVVLVARTASRSSSGPTGSPTAIAARASRRRRASTSARSTRSSRRPPSRS
jgi:hypothetical protein